MVEKKNYQWFPEKVLQRYLKESYDDYQSWFETEYYGKENQTTFYHTKNNKKRYHIDYIYTKGMDIKSISVGMFDDWIEYSGHCPLIIRS